MIFLSRTHVTKNYRAGTARSVTLRNDRYWPGIVHAGCRRRVYPVPAEETHRDCRSAG